MLCESLVCQKMWSSTGVVDIGNSQPAKNRNLSQLLSNLSRLRFLFLSWTERTRHPEKPHQLIVLPTTSFLFTTQSYQLTLLEFSFSASCLVVSFLL